MMWTLAAFTVAVVGAALIAHRAIRPLARSDAQCRSLAEALERKQESKEWDKLQVYYGLKETEMSDEEAWRKAVQKVEGELAALSNRVADCQAGK